MSQRMQKFSLLVLAFAAVLVSAEYPSTCRVPLEDWESLGEALDFRTSVAASSNTTYILAGTGLRNSSLVVIKAVPDPLNPLAIRGQRMFATNITADSSNPMAYGSWMDPMENRTKKILFLLAHNVLLAIDLDRRKEHILAGEWDTPPSSGAIGSSRLGSRGATVFTLRHGAPWIYFSDRNSGCIRLFRHNERYLSTVAGTCGSSWPMEFNSYDWMRPSYLLLPMALAVFGGDMYVSEEGADRLLRLTNISGGYTVAQVVSFWNDSEKHVPHYPSSIRVLKSTNFTFREFPDTSLAPFRHADEVLAFFSDECTVVLGLPQQLNATLMNTTSLPVHQPSDLCGNDTPMDIFHVGHIVGGVVSPPDGGNLSFERAWERARNGWTPLIGFGVESCDPNITTKPSTPSPSWTPSSESPGDNGTTEAPNGDKDDDNPKHKDDDGPPEYVLPVVIVLTLAAVAVIAAVSLKIAKVIRRRNGAARGHGTPREPIGSEEMITTSTTTATTASSSEGGGGSSSAQSTLDLQKNPAASSINSNSQRSTQLLPPDASDRQLGFSNASDSSNDRRRLLCEMGSYQKNKLLGRGANGSVYSALLSDGSAVALKEVLLLSGSAELHRDIQKEVDIVSTLHHPHVVEYYGSVLDEVEMKLTLFMEIVNGGSLGHTVRHLAEPLDYRAARSYAQQIVEALAYVHGKGVVHRDIKCENILITSDGVCKLADFGASKVVGNAAGASRAANTMIGTPFFMAPEVLTGAMTDDDDETGYGKKADIWSLGITILELMNRGNPPWPEFPNQGAAFMHIASDDSLPIIPERFRGYEDLVDFINRCCVRDPKKRWSANELLHHAWLEGANISLSGDFSINDTAN